MFPAGHSQAPGFQSLEGAGEEDKFLALRTITSSKPCPEACGPGRCGWRREKGHGGRTTALPSCWANRKELTALSLRLHAHMWEPSQFKSWPTAESQYPLFPSPSGGEGEEVRRRPSRGCLRTPVTDSKSESISGNWQALQVGTTDSV